MVLSRSALESAWVNAEVSATLDRMKRGSGRTPLALYLDDGPASEVDRGSRWPQDLWCRHALDFRGWSSAAVFERRFAELLAALAVQLA